MKSVWIGAVWLVLLFSSTLLADDPPPAWMRQAAGVTTAIYDKEVPAVVLFNEQRVSLGTDGKITTVENYAVKLLSREGRRYAVARAFYLVSAGRVKDIQGWLIRPDGSVKNYDKKTVLDLIADTDDVYNEGRLKIIDATRDVDTGAIFGYTITSEDSPLFYQDAFSFQSRLPVVISRYLLELPDGWSASSISFNSPEIKPQVNGSSYLWELRDLKPIKPEPMSPALTNLTPRIVVNYSPSDASKATDRVFANWADVSRWASSMYEPQVVIDDEIAAKARELTAGATTELEKIRAIGTYVQNIQYISIDIGVGYGNGYRPRSSALVMSRGYGDCKDKANLMRALLRVLKIETFPVAIFSGDPTFVRAEWASPRQFNHCIIAVKVSDVTKAPTVIEHEKLGRLLIFDATDPNTPVGDLPDYLQGSNALIMAGDAGGLSKMPVTPPETNVLERNLEVTIDALGELKGKIVERANGQTSTIFRREIRDLSAPDYKKSIEGWLTRGATGAQLVKMSSKDRAIDSAFDLDVDFLAPRYGQVMQGRLLVFKPVVVGRRHGIYLTEPERTNDIRIDSSSLKESAVFTLPAGFDVDELPDAVDLQTPFGSYKTVYDVKADKLYFSRALVTNDMVVSVDRYKSVKEFFTKIRDAEQSPVVLLKK